MKIVITLIYVIVCFGVTQSATATEQITEQAEPNPTNDKALARELVDEERAKFMAAWNASSLSRDKDLYGIEYVTSLLNLDFPGLVQVKAAVDSEDWGAAEDALLTYFKNRDYSDLDSPRGSMARANDALAHYFPGNKNQPSGFTGVDPEWPTSMETVVVINAPGLYTFSLTADDGQFKDTDEVIIDVWPFGDIGLIVHLPLDGNTDDVAFGFPTALIDGIDGSHEYVEGVHGQGLQLSGTRDNTDNDVVSIDFIYYQHGSICLWFKPTELYNYNSILDNSADGNDWEM